MKMINISVPGHEDATLEGYILDCEISLGQNTNRPAIVICPGGGYLYCSPREGEPVFHDRSDLVIAVMGLSAIGKPLFECCFGLAGATELLDTAADHILTAEDAAKILSSELGSRKELGNREFCVDQVVMTAFDPEERVQYDAISKG